MELVETKQVRFSKLVEQGGKPAAYLPFAIRRRTNPSCVRSKKNAS